MGHRYLTGLVPRLIVLKWIVLRDTHDVDGSSSEWRIDPGTSPALSDDDVCLLMHFLQDIRVSFVSVGREGMNVLSR